MGGLALSEIIKINNYDNFYDVIKTIVIFQFLASFKSLDIKTY